jgi:hypothetical protein
MGFDRQIVGNQNLSIALCMVIENGFWSLSKKAWSLDGDWIFFITDD